MARQIQGSQTDFSYGEVDSDLKRADNHPARKAGLRQMANARIHNSGNIQNRSGRSAFYPAPNAERIEQFTISAGNDFEIEFGTGYVRIIDTAGAQVANFGGLPWTAANVNQIVYAILGFQIFITFGHSMRPKVITLTGTVWAIADYTELVVGGQKRTPFYRISPQNITILPGAQTGSGVSLVASQPLFVAGHVGTRMRFVNRQMLITAVADSTHATVTIMESLPGHQDLGVSTDPRTAISVGDIIIGNTSGSKGIVTAIGAGAIEVQLISTNSTVVIVNYFEQRTVSFLNETVTGPGGSAVIGSAGPIDAPTIGVAYWDEEVMNDFRGYPASCFVDQFRLGFSDFPSTPNGIGWSAINSPTDLYVVGPTTPNGAIFELAPNKVRIYYVTPGPEGSEFIFCDRRVYYIPISATNPLVPGSVEFKTLSGDGAAQVQPRLAQEAIVYVNAGGNSMMAIIATGATLRPFNTRGLSDFHAHLFNAVKCIACPGADGTFNERYVYVLNGDGSLVVGKYSAGSLVSQEPVIGWGPWSGVATVKWIAAWQQNVLFTSSYFNTTICEVLDDTVYMDAALFVNALPAAFAAPPGKGPLWWIPSQTVFLMDQVTRPMGVYQIDANGFIVPQGMGGENLAAASLVAGQIWTGIVEPFSPDAPSGADQHQRMNMRAYSYFAVYLMNSTGLVFATIFSGKQTRLGTVPGTIINTRRVPTYSMDDDATLPPIQNETVEFYSPKGTTYDPRAAVLWDTPGPIQILEIAMEVSI